MPIIRKLTSYFSKEVSSQVKPQSYAETSGTVKKLFSPVDQNRALQEKFITIYEQGGLISEAFDLYPLFMFSKGYSWEGEPKAIDQCKDFMTGFDYEQSFNLAITSPLVCGDGYQEIVRGRARNPLGLLYRNPVNFDIVYDEYGLVTGYTQTIKKTFINKVIPFDEQDIFHTQLIPSLKEGAGTSLMKRAFDDITRDTQIAEGTSNAIVRHGTPKWWARVGQPGELVAQSIIDNICKKLEELNSKNDIATQYDTDIKMLDTSGVSNIQSYQDASMVRLTASLGVPGELLGFRQGTTDNTAVSRIGAFLQKISTYQTRFARQLNIQVFDQVTGVPGAAKIKFNSILPSQQAEQAAWIINLIKANPLDPEYYAPREWVKQVLNIPDTIEEVTP
ncbi:MAG: hypothetical protein PHS80_00065 [Methanothrix sp.]|nr:hypothetical protein [Methanothrix sp.]